jgi:hypothetical protein
MRISTLWLAVLVAALLWTPGVAAAQTAPPLSVGYTAADISATNHQWYVTGTTTTASTIATTGTVTWNYVTGVPASTRHDVNFTSVLKPTSCTYNGATVTPPVPNPPRVAPWTASCRFDTPGTYSFVCQVHPTMTGSIVVSPAATTAPVGGSVPATLSLALGTSAGLGNFLLGTAADYTAAVGAVVTSTGADATLTASDPSATATGHLVNGAFAMAQPLQVKATDAANPGTSFAPVTGAANPVTLLTWPGPVSNDNVLVSFKQSVAATDPLRTGTYAKTLTLTLSTTDP